MMRVLELPKESSDGNGAMSLAVSLGTLPPTFSHLLIVNKLPRPFSIRPTHNHRSER